MELFLVLQPNTPKKGTRPTGWLVYYLDCIQPHSSILLQSISLRVVHQESSSQVSCKWDERTFPLVQRESTFYCILYLILSQYIGTQHLHVGSACIVLKKILKVNISYWCILYLQIEAIHKYYFFNFSLVYQLLEVTYFTPIFRN